MSIDAGNDVASSMLHMTAGLNRLQAGGSLTRTRVSPSGELLGTVLSIGDAQVDVRARGDVFLESAFFFPEAVAGRSRRYNFVSDAGHRFERGVDPANNVDGIERATQLILDICGGQAGPLNDVVARLPARRRFWESQLNRRKLNPFFAG